MVCGRMHHDAGIDALQEGVKATLIRRISFLENSQLWRLIC